MLDPTRRPPPEPDVLAFRASRLSSDYCVGVAVGCPLWIAVWQPAQTTRVLRRRLAMS